MSDDREIGEVDAKAESRAEQKRSRVDGTGFWPFMIMLIVIPILVMSVFAYFSEDRVTHCPGRRVDFDVESIATQIQFYESMNRVLPSTEQGLAALVEMPKGEPQPRHWKQLIPEMPMDPWGKPYQYRKTSGKNRPTGFKVFSSGKDRLVDTEDDVVLKMDASVSTP